MLDVPGIVFDPYDDELIEFLEEKLKGQELEPQLQRAIKELDLYGEKEPWRLFEEMNFNQNFYVFTRLRMNKSVFKRTAGGGTWVMQKTEDVVDFDGKHLGFKKLLIFVQGKKKKNNNASSSRAAANGHWIMHEFSSATQHPEEDSYVICRIRNKDMDTTAKAASSSRRSEENRPPKRPRISEVDAPKMLESTAHNDQNGYTDHGCQPQQPLDRICDVDATKMLKSTAHDDQNGYTDHACQPQQPLAGICDVDAPKLLESTAHDYQNSMSLYYDGCMDHACLPQQPLAGICDIDAPEMLESTAHDDQNSVSLYYDGCTDHACPPQQPLGRICDGDAPKMLESTLYYDGYTDHAYQPQQPLPPISDFDAPKMSESVANKDQNSVSLYLNGYTDDAYSGLTPISDTYVNQDKNYTHNFYLHPEATCHGSNALAFDTPHLSTFNIMQQGVAASACLSGLTPTPEALMHKSRCELMSQGEFH